MCFRLVSCFVCHESTATRLSMLVRVGSWLAGWMGSFLLGSGGLGLRFFPGTCEQIVPEHGYGGIFTLNKENN